MAVTVLHRKAFFSKRRSDIACVTLLSFLAFLSIKYYRCCALVQGVSRFTEPSPGQYPSLVAAAVDRTGGQPPLAGPMSSMAAKGQLQATKSFSLHLLCPGVDSVPLAALFRSLL